MKQIQYIFPVIEAITLTIENLIAGVQKKLAVLTFSGLVGAQAKLAKQLETSSTALSAMPEMATGVCEPEPVH